MSRPDHAPDDRDLALDALEPVTARDHDCSLAPFPDTCWSCLAFERQWIRERAAVDEANRKEWTA